MAVLLSAAGIYGVMSYAVSQSVNEIGIRAASGAQPVNVIKPVVGQGMVLVGTGLGIGISSALVLTRLMANLLYEVKVTDPLIFVCTFIVSGYRSFSGQLRSSTPRYEDGSYRCFEEHL